MGVLSMQLEKIKALALGKSLLKPEVTQRALTVAASDWNLNEFHWLIPLEICCLMRQEQPGLTWEAWDRRDAVSQWMSWRVKLVSYIDNTFNSSDFSSGDLFLLPCILDVAISCSIQVPRLSALWHTWAVSCAVSFERDVTSKCVGLLEMRYPDDPSFHQECQSLSAFNLKWRGWKVDFQWMRAKATTHINRDRLLLSLCAFCVLDEVPIVFTCFYVWLVPWCVTGMLDEAQEQYACGEAAKDWRGPRSKNNLCMQWIYPPPSNSDK